MEGIILFSLGVLIVVIIYLLVSVVKLHRDFKSISHIEKNIYEMIYKHRDVELENLNNLNKRLHSVESTPKFIEETEYYYLKGCFGEVLMKIDKETGTVHGKDWAVKSEK